MASAIVIERNPETGEIVNVHNLAGEAVPFGVVSDNTDAAFLEASFAADIANDDDDDVALGDVAADDDDVIIDDTTKSDVEASDDDEDDATVDDDDKTAMKELEGIFGVGGDGSDDAGQEDMDDFLDELQITTDMNFGYADYLKELQANELALHGSHACEFCGADDASFKCKGCDHVHYCSSNCQREDWQDGHKDECHWIQINAPIAFEYEDSDEHEDSSDENASPMALGDEMIGVPARRRRGRARRRRRARRRTVRRRRFRRGRRRRMRGRMARRARRRGRRRRRRRIVRRGALWWRRPRWQSRWRRWRGRGPRFWRRLYRRYPSWRWWAVAPPLAELAILGTAGYLSRYRAWTRYWRLVCYEDGTCEWVRRRGPWWESSWVPTVPPPVMI